jgi:hypothetical protein
MAQMLELFRKEAMEMDERQRGIGWLIDDYKRSSSRSPPISTFVVEYRPRNFDEEDDDMSSITYPNSNC